MRETKLPVRFLGRNSGLSAVRTLYLKLSILLSVWFLNGTYGISASAIFSDALLGPIKTYGNVPSRPDQIESRIKGLDKIQGAFKQERLPRDPRFESELIRLLKFESDPTLRVKVIETIAALKLQSAATLTALDAGVSKDLSRKTKQDPSISERFLRRYLDSYLTIPGGRARVDQAIQKLQNQGDLFTVSWDQEEQLPAPDCAQRGPHLLKLSETPRPPVIDQDDSERCYAETAALLFDSVYGFGKRASTQKLEKKFSSNGASICEAYDELTRDPLCQMDAKKECLPKQNATPISSGTTSTICATLRLQGQGFKCVSHNQGWSDDRKEREPFQKLALQNTLRRLQSAPPRRPIGIHYCGNLLRRGAGFAGIHTSDCAGHASAIIDYRFDSQTKKCEFLIQNSWGTDCNQYHPSYRGSHCEEGRLWIPDSDLAPNLIGISTLDEASEKN